MALYEGANFFTDLLSPGQEGDVGSTQADSEGVGGPLKPVSFCSASQAHLFNLLQGHVAGTEIANEAVATCSCTMQIPFFQNKELLLGAPGLSQKRLTSAPSSPP